MAEELWLAASDQHSFLFFGSTSSCAIFSQSPPDPSCKDTRLNCHHPPPTIKDETKRKLSTVWCIWDTVNPNCSSHSCFKFSGFIFMEEAYRSLFILDGFPELQYSVSDQEEDLSTNPLERKPVETLLHSIMKTKLFPESSLLITAWPTTMKKLHSLLKQPIQRSCGLQMLKKEHIS
ncbi:hypothetical protein R6Z07F_020498 [Ovis aries]